MTTHDIIIEPDGTVRFVYSDDIAPLVDGEGESSTTRASHVEPASSFGWDDAGWLADMRPVGGPLLFAYQDERTIKHAFTTRQAALDAEREWIREHLGI